MSRATQISDRKRIAAFLREMFRGEAGLATSAADALAERCAGRIKRVVVWDEPTAASAEGPARTGTSVQTPQTAPSAANLPPAAATPTVVECAELVAPSTAAAFDPYAFSAVVVLTKAGKDGLLKRLAAIDRPEHLRKLADAQHLAVDAALSSTADLRLAIVKAAEQRIANRRAAAS